MVASHLEWHFKSAVCKHISVCFVSVSTSFDHENLGSNQARGGIRVMSVHVHCFIAQSLSLSSFHHQYDFR